MKLNKLNTQGFTHYVALIALVTVAAVGGVFVTVSKAHNNSSAKFSLARTNSGVDGKNKVGSNDKSQTELSATTPSETTSTTPTSSTAPTKSVAPTPAKSPSTSSPTTNRAPSSPASSPAPSSTPTPAPSPTPLSVLTTLIASLDNGAQINITASAVTVPGPISNAQARPIVFTANGLVYFVYHQGSAANFTIPASETAGSMAIVRATVSNPALVQAHLDKAANLVDPNISANLVGYSQGGN